MTPQIPSPTKGQPMRASWAAQVTDVCNAFRAASFAGTMTRDGAGAFGNAPLPENKRNRRGQAKLHPFEVKWGSAENEGEGAWAIWLPEIASLISMAGEYSTPTGVTAATELPTGWYTVDDAEESSTEVYAVVSVDDDDGTMTAEISVSEGQSVTGTTVYNFKIATMSTDETTGAKTVKQLIDSALNLGAVKDGEDGDDASITVEQKEIDTSTDHPNGGTKITFQPLVNGGAQGQPIVVDVYNGADGSDGLPGVGISSVVSGTSHTSGNTTVTPVTVTLTDNTTQDLNIVAQNGADGADGADGTSGADGASVTGATAGAATVGTDATTTPITFQLSNGGTVGPVNVVAKNGSDATVEVDDLSMEKRSLDDKLSIKGWRTAEPRANMTFADLISSPDYASFGTRIQLVVRDDAVGGQLAYIDVGHLQGATVNVVGDVMYDVSDHQLKKRVDTVNLLTGAVTQGRYEMITGGQAIGHSSTVESY